MSYHSHADLGGQPNFGAVVPEAEGDLFHAAWEPEALALTLAMGATGSWNIDMSRSARETLPGYASLSYYALWIEGLERLLLERALVRSDELSTGRMLHPAAPVKRVLRAADVAAALAKGSPTERTETQPARFRIGDWVKTRSTRPDHHTRLPAYAQGKVGRIECNRGVHVFADTNAQGSGEQPHWLYTVSFTGRELWGPDTEEGLVVSIDAWEPYIEPWHPAKH